MPAYVVAEALRGQNGIIDVTSAYESVGLFVEGEFTEEHVRELLGQVKFENPPTPKEHVIPVCYELGEDLSEVSSRLELSNDEVIAAHSAETYRCYAIGFCPGFAFLGYLPDSISGLPRRESPRAKVPAGSVGITGKQTGVYPMETPGGWNIIGRTPLCLVDVADSYFPICAGDAVRFRPIDQEQFEQLKGKRL